MGETLSSSDSFLCKGLGSRGGGWSGSRRLWMRLWVEIVGGVVYRVWIGCGIWCFFGKGGGLGDVGLMET